MNRHEMHKRTLLKRYKAWYEQGTWRFPSVWSKDKFVEEWNKYIKDNPNDDITPIE